eukprot:scaffold72208_cov63-Phaeocystis_antarctica.AAC.5
MPAYSTMTSEATTDRKHRRPVPLGCPSWNGSSAACMPHALIERESHGEDSTTCLAARRQKAHVAPA